MSSLSHPTIISRHQGAIDFIRAHDARFENATVLKEATEEQVRAAGLVAGNIPIHLAIHATEYVSVVMPELPRERRGTEITLQDMERYGAKLMSVMVFTTEDFERRMSAACQAAYMDGCAWPTTPSSAFWGS